MSLPKELITVTSLSKTIALIMFTLLPVIAFLLGMKYQAKLQDNQVQTPSEINVSPTVTQNNGKKIFCGGITGIVCPAGYKCQLDGNYPDAGGSCITNYP